MVIGFTGTQQGMTKFQKEELAKILKLKGCTEFVFGDSIGSEKEGCDIALECGIEQFTIIPPDNPKKRAFCFDSEKLTAHLRNISPYVAVTFGPKGKVNVRWLPIAMASIRHQNVVDICALMIAAPKEHTHSHQSEVWRTIRYAWHTKKDIIIIPPIERPEEHSEYSDSSLE